MAEAERSVTREVEMVVIDCIALFYEGRDSENYPTKKKFRCRVLNKEEKRLAKFRDSIR